MNADGTKSGFSVEITREVSKSVNIPVIASGGAGYNGALQGGLHKNHMQCRSCGKYFSLRGNINPGTKGVSGGKGD